MTVQGKGWELPGTTWNYLELPGLGRNTTIYKESVSGFSAGGLKLDIMMRNLFR